MAALRVYTVYGCACAGMDLHTRTSAQTMCCWIRSLCRKKRWGGLGRVCARAYEPQHGPCIAVCTRAVHASCFAHISTATQLNTQPQVLSVRQSCQETGSQLCVLALPVLQLHARALLPQGNFFKALQTKWRLFQAMLKSASQPEQAAQLQDKLLSEVRRRWCGSGVCFLQKTVTARYTVWYTGTA